MLVNQSRVVHILSILSTRRFYLTPINILKDNGTELKRTAVNKVFNHSESNIRLISRHLYEERQA